jgi:hypothetical protein
MKTKEDTKNNDVERKPNVIKETSHKVEGAPEQELLGILKFNLGFKSVLSGGEVRKPREDK